MMFAKTIMKGIQPWTTTTIDERETIFLMRNHGNSLLEIASHTKKSYSTISRELSRNSTGKSYSPSKAQEKYKQRKEKQVPTI